MGALKRMIKPTIGILTNIGGAHQENFFSLQEKCMEKLTLFKDCDVVIYNGDNELISNCVAKSMLTAREIAWSCKDIERPLYISKVTKKEDHTVIAYRYLDMDNIFCIPFYRRCFHRKCVELPGSLSLSDDSCRSDYRTDGTARTDRHAPGSKRRQRIIVYSSTIATIRTWLLWI